MTDTREAEPPRAPRDLADWLIAHGRHFVTLSEAADLLDAPKALVPPVVGDLQRKGQMFRPTRGFYVPVPPQYRTWGVVPASHFIDPLMKHLGHTYYVGLLSAAELHGAAHQRPQVFQVVTPARLRDRAFDRVKIQFITSARSAERATSIVNTPTGTICISSPETTVLDLVTWPRHGGGISNVATVMGEMLQDDLLDPAALESRARSYPAAVAKRTGWLIDRVAGILGIVFETDALARLASARSEPAALAAGGRRAGALDVRWNILVNFDVEPDL